jgi:glycine cleavage system P protein (glycine dehydrogenase) subunit 1
MPFIPHTESEISTMLEAIGAKNIDELFDEIPKELLNNELDLIPQGISEMELNRLVDDAVTDISNGTCFIGAGSYNHHIPAAVWQIASRGEFLTAYTPYQAEASQGSLQLLYEFQTMISELTAMDLANASMYDGATALAEAVLMAVRANKKSKAKRILLVGSLHPFYLETVETIVGNQHIELVTLPFNKQSGVTDLTTLSNYQEEDITALVIAQPNFFGCLEQVDAMTDWAHEKNALVIACVNPTALAILSPPGDWGNNGADIVCGEGQPLGVPMASGGPYFGFFACSMKLARQMPGRIIGRTLDKEGNHGFTLTLQAREQHIRRSKATSNICTNQGLLVTAATIYMSLLGANGLSQVARASHDNTQKLIKALTKVKGVNKLFNASYFHEAVITTPMPAAKVLSLLNQHEIAGGFDVSTFYPELGNAILICATEMVSAQDIANYANVLEQVLS